MKFPVEIEFKDQRAKIYRPAKSFAFYRISFRTAGKRRMLTFGTYGEAKKAAEEKVRELHNGQQSAGLTAKQSQDAIVALQRLVELTHATGRKVSLLSAVSEFAEASSLLKGRSLIETAQTFLQSIASVKRKDISEAVEEFIIGREAMQLRWFANLDQLPKDNKLSAAPFVILGEQLQTELRKKNFDDTNPTNILPGLARRVPMKKFIFIFAIVLTVTIGAFAQFGFLQKLQGNSNASDNQGSKVSSIKNMFSDAGKVLKGVGGIGLQEELTIGNSVAVQIVSKYGGLVRDPAINRRVNLVGKSLAYYCDRPDLNFRFGVLNSPTVNAFSTPGGYVFITRGLYDLIQNNDQLAGVLAHEITHVTRKHALKIIERGQFFEGITGLASDAGTVSKKPDLTRYWKVSCPTRFASGSLTSKSLPVLRQATSMAA